MITKPFSASGQGCNHTQGRGNSLTAISCHKISPFGHKGKEFNVSALDRSWVKVCHECGGWLSM